MQAIHHTGNAAGIEFRVSSVRSSLADYDCMTDEKQTNNRNEVELIHFDPPSGARLKLRTHVVSTEKIG